MIRDWVHSSLDVQPELGNLREAARRLDPDARHTLSQELIAELRQTWQYTGARSWNRLVCLCEALAEVGWGKLTRLDAVCIYGTDGWATSLIDRRHQPHLQWGWWGKRKAGWRLLTVRVYCSPDFPEVVPTDYVHTTAPYHDEQVPRLFSQRNYQRQCPLGFPLYCAMNEASEMATAIVRDLHQLLIDIMHPDLYGDPLEHFYFSVLCPGFPQHSGPGLKIGSFNAKTRSFYSELYLPEDFARLNPQEQTEFLRVQLAKAIDSAEDKLRRRKLVYRFDLFRADVDRAFQSLLDAEA
ncbi:MAG: hypothetical protein NTU53_06045 [Planctomycetota bacterium]|nr:hypothetical protein [Planctomycetota bacterium]